MSNHWDLRCLDCDVDAGLSWNHGERQLNELVPLLAAIAAAKPAMDLLDCEVVNSTYLDFSGAPSCVAAFAAHHAGHRVVPVDEYGALSGECGRSYQCGCCGLRPKCHLPPDHAGPHRPTSDTLTERDGPWEST